MINTEFTSILQLLKAFPDEQSCIDHLESIRWEDRNIVSPFDPDSKVYICKNNRYRCKNTGKYFNVRTNTLFENTKVSLQKWFLAIWLVTSHKKGISSLQLSRDIDVTQKTAWFMLQRIRNCFGMNNDTTLSNDIEVDETYVGGKNKNRHASKKVKNAQGRSCKDKTPVVGMVERGGKLVAKKVNDVKGRTLIEQIKGFAKNAVIFTDEWGGYNHVKYGYEHHVVKHNEGEYVKGKAHTNTIEGFWSLLKRGIIGIYHSVSPKHLQYYVDEFVFRYNLRKMRDSERFNMLLKAMNHRLTYPQLIA